MLINPSSSAPDALTQALFQPPLNSSEKEKQENEYFSFLGFWRRIDSEPESFFPKLKFSSIFVFKVIVKEGAISSGGQVTLVVGGGKAGRFSPSQLHVFHALWDMYQGKIRSPQPAAEPSRQDRELLIRDRVGSG